MVVLQCGLRWLEALGNRSGDRGKKARTMESCFHGGHPSLSWPKRCLKTCGTVMYSQSEFSVQTIFRSLTSVSWPARESEHYAHEETGCGGWSSNGPKYSVTTEDFCSKRRDARSSVVAQAMPKSTSLLRLVRMFQKRRPDRWRRNLESSNG